MMITHNVRNYLHFFFILIAVIMLSGCLQADTIEVCIEFNTQGKVKITQVFYGIKSSSHLKEEIENDFNELIGWTKIKREGFYERQGFWPTNVRIFIDKNNKLVGVITGWCSRNDFSNKLGFYEKNGEFICILSADEDHIETNGKKFSTQKNCIISWLSDEKRIQIKIKDKKAMKNNNNLNKLFDKKVHGEELTISYE